MLLSTKCVKRIGILFGLMLLLTFSFSLNQALAVSSFSRMYKMSCLACHTNTPRVNYFGEKLMVRGYELDKMTLADTPAGHVKVETSCTACHNSGKPFDEVGGEKTGKTSSNLFLHKVSNFLSIKMKFTPLELVTNELTEEGKLKTKVTVANPNWMQLWIAGPIAENIALRAEAELAEDKHVGLHNYAVAFSNVLNSNGLLNLRVGGFTHGEWLSIGDQKRFFAPHFNIYNAVKTKGDDSFKVSGAEPAIEAYGYTGPVVYQAGVSSGKNAADVNTYKNYWGTAKYYLFPSGELAGTNVSAQYISGVDTKDAALVTMKKDNFHRSIVSAILRYAPLEIMGSYVQGKDDNWKLDAAGADNEFKGGFVQALYSVTNKLTVGTVYQTTTSDDSNLKYGHLLLGGNYYIRENVLISTYYDADLLEISTAHPDKLSTLAVNFRAMF